jgi:peptide/nickel transport system substrate-binding protein
LAAAVLAIATAGVIAVTSATAGTQQNTHAGAAGKNVAKAGGTFRVGWESSFDFTDDFDPTGEYLAEAFGIYSDLLLRNLVGYNHVAGAPGNIIVPDMATNTGVVTNGGKTYTFHIKPGIKFGPPINRAITSKDFLEAFERIGTASVNAQYYFYYSAIKGMDAFHSGKAKVISGIQTPNDSTIVFNLTKPTGDFLFRLSMPAAAPIPPEVGSCFTKPGDYGRYVISSGPYMVAGEDKLNTSSCSALIAGGPMSGFDGTTTLDLVRNPNYSAATDSPKARENLPDAFDFTVDTNTDDIYAKVGRGDLEEEIAGETPSVLRQYKDSPQLHTNDGDRTWYITMNLTQPPFDDVHVRRALNYVIDRDALRKAWGGPSAGAIATHIAPDGILLNKLKGYAPYGKTGTGDLAKAKAEMMKSTKYDPKHDGMCDVKACQNIFTVTGDRSVEVGFIPVLEQNLKTIGITLKDRVLKDAYTPIQTPRLNIPLSTRPGWGKDYADALTFFAPLMDGRNIIPTGNTNYSLLGITAAQAKKDGVKGDVAAATAATIEPDLDKCAVLAGNPRVSCYAALDKKLTTQIVPWVPYLWAYAQSVSAKDVTQFGFDQFGGTIAYAHVAME